MFKKFEIHARAKINLALQVLNKREDGYHNINTIFYPTTLKDILIFERCDKFSLEMHPDLGIPLESNLVYKAYQMLKSKYSPDYYAKITLIKQIPTGGGLGGGSSDAAAAVAGLAKALRIDLPEEHAKQIASSLGSDVPYFLLGGAAIGSGRGEILERIDLKINYPVLIINPGIHISTADAYSALARTTTTRPETDFGKFLIENKNDPARWREALYNDFEEFAFRYSPVLKAIKEKLYKLGALFAQMSGSGSTMFGVFPDKASARRAAANFPELFRFISDENSI